MRPRPWLGSPGIAPTRSAYLPTRPALPTRKMACPCNCKWDREIESHRVLRKIVGFPWSKITKTPPFSQSSKFPDQIRADSCTHNFSVTSASSCLH
jgi:hypothetical protein